MKKVVIYYFIFFLVLTGTLVFSCVKDPYKDKLSQEKSQIADYVSQHNIRAQVSSSGLYFISEDTAGDHPGSGDYVLIKYRATFLDGTLFDTTDSIEAQSMNGHLPWFKTGGPLTFGMNSNFIGLVEGLSLLREGGKATLIMPSTLASNDFNFKPRIYDVELLKIYHDIAGYQRQFFDSLVTNIGFKMKDSTKSGVWIDTTDVLGDNIGLNFPTYNDTVAVKYTVSMMDGYSGQEVFGRQCMVVDSFKYPMDTIPAPFFNEALLKMTRYGKAIIYAPSYNANGAGAVYDYKTGQIIIPPYTNLRYDIEFLGFVNSKGIIDKNRY